jgi:hypothetical protein
LELYLELLAVRSSLVATSKDIPRDMIEVLTHTAATITATSAAVTASSHSKLSDDVLTLVMSKTKFTNAVVMVMRACMS